MYNVGAFFRTADGAGIERIYLSGITARPPKRALSKTALGAEERVPGPELTIRCNLSAACMRAGMRSLQSKPAFML